MKSAKSLANTEKRFPFDVPVKFIVVSMKNDPQHLKFTMTRRIVKRMNF